MRGLAKLLPAAMLLAGPAWAQGTAVNPPVGSVWTYLGPTYGASWATTPFGTGPPPPGDNNWLAKWNSGGSIKSAYGAPPAGNLVGVYVEPDSATLGSVWGPHVFHVGSRGAVNNAVFGVDMNAAPGTQSFPTAIMGYGRISVGSTGNLVFGVTGRADLYAASGSAVSAEFTAANNSGSSNVAVGLPPDMPIPVTTRNAKGVNITCSGTGLGDCSVGLDIANDIADPTKPVFNTAAYIQYYRQYGLVIDAMPSGTQTSAVLKNNGAGVALQLQVTGAYSAPGTVATVLTSDGYSRWNVRQSGDMYLMGHLVSWTPGGAPAVRPTLTACGGGSPSVHQSTDIAGVITVGTGTVTACTINFYRPFQLLPTCALTGEAGMPPLVINTKTISSLTVGVASGNMAGAQFHYVCVDAL